MNITEILPDTEEYAITRKLLRDVDFHMDVKHLTAICNNNIEVGYIESLAMNDIIEWTKKKFGKKTVTLEIIKTNTPDSSAEIKTMGTIEGSGVLRRDYNFDNFIAGSSNKVALASAIKISRSQPGQKASNNFLYIHGGVGLGKTHLLHAVMNNLIGKGKNIAFFNGSEFADYILQAVNQQGVSYTQTMQLFKQVDALAVDDIGFLNNDSMPRVMREFKAILDHLISGGKFGLFTGAYLPPDEHWKLIPEVATRLITGYVASVEVPDRNLRRDIIENEFAKVGIEVVQNVISFIADADIRDIRTIQEICHRLTVEKDAGNILDIERVAGVLKYHHIKTQPPDEQIVTQAMERMEKRISLDELKRKDLPKELFLIRNETMYELVEKQGISQTSVARAFGMSPQRISMIVGAIKRKQVASM